MRKATNIEQLLQWRRERAESQAPPAPSGVHLLNLAQPWWELWPDRFAASVRRLTAIQLSFGYAMAHPPHGHSGHPVAALISRDNDGDQEAPVRILYMSVRDGRLRLRFQVGPIPRTDSTFELTFVSENGWRPILSASADRSGDDEYSVDVELPSEIAAAWESLRVTDPMPFRFILRPAPNTN